MKNQDFTPQEERKLRFAEAGILFALILGIAVFVGVRLNGDGPAAPQPTVVTAVETPAATDVADAPEDVATAQDGDIVVTTGPEPAAEVSPASASAPEPVVVTYAMAEQAYFDGDYEGAAGLFERYAAAHPDNAWGQYMLGLSAWKAGDAESADAAFAAALALDPKHVKSLVNDARVLLELDRTDEANTRVAAALDLDPANVDAYRVLGRVRQAQARVDEAKAAYEDALRLDAGDVWSLNNLGLLLIEQERYGEALAPLAKAAGLDPKLACVQNNLGIALERTGHYADAADAYARALDASPGYAKAETSRARVLALSEIPGTDPVDLVALAESFTVAPAATAMAAADEGMEPKSPDMEVAAAVVNPGVQPEEPAATPPQSEDAASDDGGSR